jgi:localization factor PodJL
MDSGRAWEIDGVRRHTRDTAQEAARRAGMPVGEWLERIILDSARQHGIDKRLLEPSPADLAAHIRAPGDDLGQWPMATPPDQAATDGAERRRRREGDLPGDAGIDLVDAPKPPLPRPRTQELSVLERQLRQINNEIETSAPPCGLDNAVHTLRDDLAEIALMLQEAMPRTAIDALENEVRKLADRIDRKGDGAAEVAAVTGIERGLAEVRDALRSLTPAENLAGLDRAVRDVARKVDSLADNAQDPSVLRQLEVAIAMMRGIASRVASSDALASLAEEVRALARKIDQASSSGVADTLSALEARIAMLADALEARNRKLDVSDARLHQLDGIERGLAELLNDLAHRREASSNQAALPPERPASPGFFPDDSADAAESTTVRGLRAGGPHTAERPPIEPDSLSDEPLQFDSEAPRGRQADGAAERITASYALTAGANRPLGPDVGGKSSFIAAARRAARAAGPVASDIVHPSPRIEIPPSVGVRVRRARTRHALALGASAVLLVLGGLQIATTMLSSSEQSNLETASRASPAVASAPAAGPSWASAPASSEQPHTHASPASGQKLSASPAGDGDRALVSGSIAADAQPAIADAAKADTSPEGHASGAVAESARPSGSPSMPAESMPAAVSHAPASALASDPLPAAFGSVLRTAAAKGDANAQYEVALRYFEGRGVAQDPAAAADWFERAARQGMAPAQFRLGGLYENGLGVKKNLVMARRLYLAAGEAGHGKALHNLAVLYAEGVDGKPDYRTAAVWFRKAAGYGVADSQYNLAILYARGIGVEQNLVEAYKWFSVAARDGDVEAARKRDSVGARLDAQSLQAGAQAAQAWTPQPQPEAAVRVQIPVGGWDAPAPAPAKRNPPAAGSKPDLATPHSAQ